MVVQALDVILGGDERVVELRDLDIREESDECLAARVGRGGAEDLEEQAAVVDVTLQREDLDASDELRCCVALLLGRQTVEQVVRRELHGLSVAFAKASTDD